jgi:LPS-assembly lipoprotein
MSSLLLRCLRWSLPVALGVAVLGGCGWRLQGTARLPEVMSVAFVDTNDRYTDFNRALRKSLTASGARLVNDRTQARGVIRIRRDMSGQRVLSVSARNTPEEYEVFYTVEYSVEGPAGELIPPQILELTRDYSYDETAVLAKQREQAILREALARDLAGLVLRPRSTKWAPRSLVRTCRDCSSCITGCLRQLPEPAGYWQSRRVSVMADQDKLQRQLGEIGTRYLKRTLGELEVLRDLMGKVRAGEAGCLKDIEHLSHKIHGSGAMFGFDDLSRQARDIELAATQSDTPDLHDRLERHINELAVAAQNAARERGI